LVAVNDAIFGLVGSRERPIRDFVMIADSKRGHVVWTRSLFLDARADAYRRPAIVREMNLTLSLLCMRKHHRSMSPHTRGMFAIRHLRGKRSHADTHLGESVCDESWGCEQTDTVS